MSDVGRYRKVFPRLWRHPGFRTLPETAQRIALYILTGPQANRIGLYCFSIATAAEDLSLGVDTFRKRLADVQATFGWQFDADARVIFVPSWWRWNQPENPNVLQGNLKDLNEVPPCGLMDAFAANIETLDATLHQTFVEGCTRHLPKRYPNQDQNQDHRQDQKREQQQANRRSRRAAESVDARDSGRLDAAVRKASRHFTRIDDIEFQIDTVRNFFCEVGLKPEDATRNDIVAALARAELRPS